MAVAIVAAEADGLFVFLSIQASLAIGIFDSLKFFYQGKKLCFLESQVPPPLFLQLFDLFEAHASYDD